MAVLDTLVDAVLVDVGVLLWAEGDAALEGAPRAGAGVPGGGGAPGPAGSPGGRGGRSWGSVVGGGLVREAIIKKLLFMVFF